MCVVCYLSTDRELVEIPFVENDRHFNVGRTEERPTCLSKRYVYYCGSSLGCGCGFGRMGITEEILQRTKQDWVAGKLTAETEQMWWDQFQVPPESRNKFDEQAEEIRAAHRDTTALYRLIEETRKAGFACEVLVCWSGEEENHPEETKFISSEHDRIEIDFDIIGRFEKNSLLYQFESGSKR